MQPEVRLWIAHIVAGIPKLTYLSTTATSKLAEMARLPRPLQPHDYHLALITPPSPTVVSVARQAGGLGPHRCCSGERPSFGLGRGETGSEDIAAHTTGSNLVYCARLPPSGHAILLSADTAQHGNRHAAGPASDLPTYGRARAQP